MVLTALVGAPPAYAKKRRRSKTKRVKTFKKKAFKRFAAGDYEGGISYMEKAHELRPHPGFLLNIAVAYDRWGGHCTESLETFDRFFELCDGCKLAAQAKKKQAKVREGCRVEIQFETEPAGAALSVDGELIGPAPQTLRLEPGPHTVVAVRADYLRLERTIEVQRNGETRIRLEMEPEATAVEPPPPAPPPPPPPLMSTTLKPRNDEGLGLTPWTWTAFGVAAVGAGIGTWFTFQTLSALDAEEAARQARLTKVEVEALQADATNKAIVANVGFGVAAAGAAAGILLLILDDDPEDGESSVSWTPTLGPRSVGLSARF